MATFPPLDANDVGREVVLAAEQRRADPVRVNRAVQRLEPADLLRVEAAGDDDAHALVAGGVERLAHALHEPGVDAGGRNEPISSSRARSTRFSEVSSRTPHSLSPSASATSSAVRTESLSKSTSTVTFISPA